MELIDFLTSLPAEEKDYFLDLLKETESLRVAVRGTMLILADSEPKLARKLEAPVRDWLKINGPILPGSTFAAGRDGMKSGMAAFEPERTY